MDGPAIGVPLGLVLVWASSGIGLLVAYRVSNPRTVLRAAAAFLGLWAILATTLLVWVLAEGGWSALVGLTRAPLAPLEPGFAPIWALGALGALFVLATAFLLNQLVGRSWLATLKPRPIPWPARLEGARESARLLAFPSPAADAFSFTLVELSGRGRARRRDVILVSEGLWAQLDEPEREAVVAHELGHLQDLDGRYLTFFRTFARLMRWDPVIDYLARALTWREEYRADDAAVALTQRPRALARALFKASAPSSRPGDAARASLLGIAGPRGRAEAARRIRRLTALAESGRYPPEPDGR